MSCFMRQFQGAVCSQWLPYHDFGRFIRNPRLVPRSLVCISTPQVLQLPLSAFRSRAIRFLALRPAPCMSPAYRHVCLPACPICPSAQPTYLPAVAFYAFMFQISHTGADYGTLSALMLWENSPCCCNGPRCRLMWVLLRAVAYPLNAVWL